ncbi:hypothetical protein [Leptospira jelokensis]|uniref:Uncharacterized protein n=1 Tax=Leptospira jelokensis TaxID=2484931 RepID=A0A4Z0ZWQ0_9LEPT|nr:hypothetical protein [Leptospira jelokensis]TGL58632.1 hypothetical protein EHQ62_17205 [Leptospira jelokensis]
MPSRQEISYSTARDKLDLIIQHSSAEVRIHLKTLSKERTAITTQLMKEWVARYAPHIRGFTDSFDPTDIQTRLSDAYFEYIKYSFMYRFLNGLQNNTLYRKIFSFELHFLSKAKVLEVTNKQNYSELSDDEALFHISPLGHFLSYKLQKEFHVTPKNISDIDKERRIYDFILDTIRVSFTEFFSQYSDQKTIPLDSFREFLKHPNNINIEAVFKQIEKRPFKIL